MSKSRMQHESKRHERVALSPAFEAKKANGLRSVIVPNADAASHRWGKMCVFVQGPQSEYCPAPCY